jgi:hypothetical protein
MGRDMMSRGRRGGTAGFERTLMVGSVGCALLALGGGVYLANRWGDPHWMNRAGAAMVAVEGIIVIAEFIRRSRLQKILYGALMSPRKDTDIRGAAREERRRKAFSTLEEEIEKAELHVLVIAISLAAAGELLHGFGDLLYEAFH